MRRFEEILRLLSSVLLGTVVRDFEEISNGVYNFLNQKRGITLLVASQTEMLSTGIVVVLLAVYLRNIHGSAAFDTFVGDKAVPKLERNVSGRVVLFLLMVSGLFITPILAHVLRFHLHPGRLGTFFVILFLPIAVYSVWNFILWVNTGDEDEEDYDEDFASLADNWIRIDAVALLCVIILGIVYLFLDPFRNPVPPHIIGLAFISISMIVIISDYVWNHKIYFPERDAEKKAKCPYNPR